MLFADELQPVFLAEQRARGQVTTATRVPTGLFRTFKEEDLAWRADSRAVALGAVMHARVPWHYRPDFDGMQHAAIH